MLLSADIGLTTQAHDRFGALIIELDHVFRFFIYCLQGTAKQTFWLAFGLNL